MTTSGTGAVDKATRELLRLSTTDESPFTTAGTLGGVSVFGASADAPQRIEVAPETADTPVVAVTEQGVRPRTARIIGALAYVANKFSFR